MLAACPEGSQQGWEPAPHALQKLIERCGDTAFYPGWPRENKVGRPPVIKDKQKEAVAPKSSGRSQEQPSQEQPEAAKNSQKQPEAAKGRENLAQQ